MRKRTIILSVLGGLLCLGIIDGSIQRIRANDTLSGPIDLAGVKLLAITGRASEIEISADGEGKAEAVLTGTRHGWGAIWRSSWFGRDCASIGSMERHGDTVTVHMGGKSDALAWRDFFWNDADDCTLSLKASLEPEAAVSIRQNAARMVMTGDFASIDLVSDAGDFSLVGHASKLAIEGAALRARLTFERITQSEANSISGKMLDASLRFLVPTKIAYGVEAVASFVDSALPNTPGAKPDIRIRGDMVRVSIR
ncbi:hypothetical protein [Peteryoungia ipomoeae]|uniref:Uncharacterized protein n=1 Tax=Peteryoungia ipomoeae TaxID=1210932 RepID=A0A4V4HMQ3_9HYPH|nr:hypothetical protein [Peteryoungia ipomoeae]THV22956.1 hypothetical protein FAA97_09990 [Peteryoungia ipomoeae]